MDSNMLTALAWAGNLAAPQSLPVSLRSVCKRTEMIDRINNALGGISARLYPNERPKVMLLWPSAAQEEFRSRVLAISQEFITEGINDNEKNAVGLRLWSGCLSAAKTIATGTMDGDNTPDMRRAAFEGEIDRTANMDPIYKAGVEVAPIWKEFLGQEVHLEGVPETSAVRRYWNIT